MIEISFRWNVLNFIECFGDYCVILGLCWINKRWFVDDFGWFTVILSSCVDLFNGVFAHEAFEHFIKFFITVKIKFELKSLKISIHKNVLIINFIFLLRQESRNSKPFWPPWNSIRVSKVKKCENWSIFQCHRSPKAARIDNMQKTTRQWSKKLTVIRSWKIQC